MNDDQGQGLSYCRAHRCFWDDDANPEAEPCPMAARDAALQRVQDALDGKPEPRDDLLRWTCNVTPCACGDCNRPEQHIRGLFTLITSLNERVEDVKRERNALAAALAQTDDTADTLRNQLRALGLYHMGCCESYGTDEGPCACICHPPVTERGQDAATLAQVRSLCERTLERGCANALDPTGPERRELDAQKQFSRWILNILDGRK